MKTTFTNYDPANYLNTEEDIQAYLQVSFEEDGIEGLQKSLGVVSCAKTPPVSKNIPNAETLAAMQNVEAGRNLTKCKSISDLFSLENEEIINE